MKKIHISLITILALLQVIPCFSQDTQTFPEKDLQITWHLITNNYSSGEANLSSFTLKNNGNIDFPARGWTIYFNFNREVNSQLTEGSLNILHVNGDINQLKPNPDFAGLKPNDSIRITFVSDGEVFNYTSAPCGFYIVWDNSPSIGISLTNTSINPITDKTINFVTPQQIYLKNQTIVDIPIDSLPRVFPTPKMITRKNGEFLLDANVQIIAELDFMNEANILSNDLSLILGKKLAIVSTPMKGKKILLTKSDMTEESYKLEIQPEEIIISASTEAGIFYGIQSLKSCFPVTAWERTQSKFSIPNIYIEDAPRFGFRSFMLDVARNFQSKEELLKVIDLMSLYKLNTLHLHFSDDEGWRIEISSLPELTEVGGRRGHTLDSKEFLPPSYGAGPEPGRMPASGYYSRTDFIEILKYAKERHVQVIPEIESPGHSRAAIKAMDKRYRELMDQGNKIEAERYLLRDLKDQSKYSSAQLWTDNVMCVALPSTYNFIEKVIDELIAMYHEANAPLTTIHLGGDEVPNGAWQQSPACSALIASNFNMHTSDDLWYYYFTKIDEILSIRNLQLSGWEEIAMRKTKLNGEKHYIPNPDFANRGFRAHVWNNGIGWGSEDLPYRLANAGYKVVLSCVSHLYFDLMYEKSPQEPGYYWGGFNDIDKPFSFIPFDYYKNTKEDAGGRPIDSTLFIGKDRLTDYGKSNILGIQGQLFAENVRSTSILEYLLFPKLLSLAERTWTPDPLWANASNRTKSLTLYNNAWSVFVNTLGKKELPRLDYYSSGVNYRIPTVGAVVENGKVFANIQIPGLTIRYTSDGTEPTSKSKIYLTPITEKGIITLCAYTKSGRKGRSIQVENK